MIAVPELRMALRSTLATANAAVMSTDTMPVSGAAAASLGGLSPSAMVFGEIVRRFESRQSRMGGPPSVDYAALLKAILNQGSRPSFASYLGDDVGRRKSGQNRAGGRDVDRLDDEFMRMIREGRWDDRGRLEDLFYRIDKVSKKSRTVLKYEEQPAHYVIIFLLTIPSSFFFFQDRSGRISVDEFRDMFREMGIRTTRAQVDDLVYRYDRNGDGQVSWREFVDAVLAGDRYRGSSGRTSSPWVGVLDRELTRRIEDAKWTRGSLKDLFRRFDKDGSGRLSVRDFKSAFAEMGIPARYADIDELIDRIDKNRDGVISYSEFIDAAIPETRQNRNRDRYGGNYNDRYDSDRDWGRSRGRDRGRDSRGRERDYRGRDRDRDYRDRDRDRDYRDRDRDRDYRDRDRDRDYRDRDRDRDYRDRGRDRDYRDRGRDRDYRDRGRDRDYRDRDRDRDYRDRGRERGYDRDNRRRTGNRKVDYLDDTLCRLIKDASWNETSLQKLFSKFDKDRSGRISAQEFRRAFEGLNIPSSDYDVNKLIDRIDQNGDGYIDIKEFVDAAFRPRKGKVALGRAGQRGASGNYSHYGDAIDKQLRKMVQDAKFSQAAMKQLFARFDRNHSGRIRSW